MKVTLKEAVKGLSGKIEDSVYYYHPRIKRTLVRRLPKMPIQSQNIDYGNIAQKIKALDPSPEYRNDFKVFLMTLREYDDKANYPSWYSLLVKMLWAMQAKYPQSVDLKSITKAQVLEQNLPCISVQSAVDDGLLPKLPGYEYLNHQI